MKQPDITEATGSVLSSWNFYVYPTQLLWSLFLCIAASLFCWYYSSTYSYFKRMSLKGPRPLPILGNILSFITRSVASVDLENVRAYGKVHGTFSGHGPNLMVADPDIIKDVLVKEFSSFINRPPIISRVVFGQPEVNRGLFAIHDEHWKHVRAVLSPTFTSGKLKEMLPTIDECAKVLLTYLDRRIGCDVNVKEILSAFSLDVIAGTAFGLDIRSMDSPGDDPALKHLNHLTGVGRTVHRSLAILAGAVSPKIMPVLRKFGISMFDQAGLHYFERVVRSVLESKDFAEERKNFITLCRGDLVNIDQVDQSTIRSTSDGKLWTTKGLLPEDIVSNALLFLQAGFEPVSALLTFFCYAMATNKQAQQMVYEELIEHEHADLTYQSLKDMRYLDLCIEETLRMYPPFVRLFRHCNQDLEIGGIRITKGLPISILVYALHYDSVHWPEPYTFRPERFLPEEKAKRHPYAYLPFGDGPRFCIANRLALLEAKTAIVKILTKYEICPCEGTPRPPLLLGVGTVNLSSQKPIVLRFLPREAQT